jgi:hypothetical protein
MAGSMENPDTLQAPAPPTDDILKTTNLTDKASAIINLAFMGGATIAPIIGGGLFETIGFT